MKIFVFLLLLVLSLFQLSNSASPKAPQGILNAVETLSSSGYNAMALTIQMILTDSSLPLQTTSTSTSTTKTPSLTIFAPPDSSFESSGQPSLAQLLLHFTPLSLSLDSLSSLPLGTTIHTLSPSSTPLRVSSRPGAPEVSINNVRVLGSPIYDDGSVIVFAIETFFPLNFTLQAADVSSPNPPQCSRISTVSTLSDASAKLKSRGYSIMASFLDLQLIAYLDPSLQLTMFAPEDQVLISFSGDVPTYSALFVKHLLPCKLTYSDLNAVKNGTIFKGNFEGLSTIIERTDTDLFVNGVEITFPDLYSSDWLVIHGISDAITKQPDDTVVEEEAMETEEEEEEADEHGHKQSVSSVSYEKEASGPDATEL